MKTQLTVIMETYRNNSLTDYIKPQKFFMPFEYIEDQEYKRRTTVERVNAYLKEYFQLDNV
ncbi:hypothetical protein J2S08_002108 [Bacillus chungangensis]|uniref:Transposase n=1 Tax=Bacillus chungangensis TaxID=587633 RepID=A0ABT9WSL0_9BACI|nr:hypothetical protein [Bacillus chungangensis]